MKTLMILGANALQIPLIEQANKRKLKTIVVSPNKAEPGHRFASCSVFMDVCDEQSILRIAEKNKIDGIITDQTDLAVRSVAYVAEKLGLPGIGYDTACLFTDKYLMREKMNELGIKTLQYKKVTSMSDAVDYYEACNNCLIMKPVDNQGSKGVSLIDSREKLMLKYEEAVNYSRCKEVLLEQVAIGREFVVEGLSFDNQFDNLICGDTYYFDIPDVFSAKQRVFPSNADDCLVSKVNGLNKKIIEGFGLKQGISHSEFIMNGNDIILIETAARGGGVFISSDLISLSTGLNTEDFLINISLGEQNSFPTITNNNIACCYLAFYLPVGKVVSVKGILDVLQLPYIHRNNLSTIKMGMETKPYTDKTSRFFTIISADNRLQLNDRIKEIQSLLNGIQVCCLEGNLVGPIWN